jgi:peptide/nickel transport system permease protein
MAMLTEGHKTVNNINKITPRVSELHRFYRVFFSRKLVSIGLVIVLIVILTAIFAPLLAPYSPNKQNLDESLLSPSRAHLLGTDAFGRDSLSRIIYGSSTSLMIGMVAVFIAAFLGLTLGLLAGFFGGVTNAVIMRFIDALMSLPMIMLALVIAAVLGGGVKNVMIALGVGLLPGYARLMCAQVISVKENDYILASRTIGASNLRTMLVHIVPNSFPPLIVMMTAMIGLTILAEAGLSFLGIGISPPTAAWGAMVSDGYRYLLSNPILSIAPGVAIMLVVFAFNMVGDGLRDALDPRFRGTF